MKLAIILSIFLILISGCTIVQNPPPGPTINTTNTTNTVSGVQELLLNEQDLQQLGMTSGGYDELHQLGWIENGTDCKTEEYNTSEDSPLAQNSICSYIIESLNNTGIIIQLDKYATLEALNGSYQYGSLHLRSIEGLLSQDDYGDQSRFYLNNVNDYGGEFTDPNISYYALYFTKNEYLIYISSKGSKEAREYVANTGRLILSKFG